MPNGVQRTVCDQAAELVQHRRGVGEGDGQWQREDCIRVVAVWEGAKGARTPHEVRKWMMRAAVDLVGGVEVALLEFCPGVGLRVVARRGVDQLKGQMGRDSGGFETGKLALAGDGLASFADVQSSDDTDEAESALEIEAGLLAAVPVRAGYHILGVLAIYAASAGKVLDSSDHAVLLAIGRHGGVLLQRLQKEDGRPDLNGRVSVA